MKLTDLIKMEYEKVEEEKKEIIHKPKLSSTQQKMKEMIIDLADYIIKSKEAFWYAYEHFTRKIINDSLTYKKEDVEEFCFTLAEIESDYLDFSDFSSLAGNFLSALINTRGRLFSEKETYTLYTHQFQQEIDRLGKENTQHLHIKGNVGHSLGTKMQEGSISVEGNVGRSAFENMHGGTGFIEGNAKDHLCQHMHEGTVTLNGNAMNNTGSYMKGGLLTLCKNTGDFSGTNMKNGIIIIQGNTNDHTGYGMQNGKIVCYGNVKDTCGVCMEGGIIIAKRNAGDYLGLKMKRGTILVEGNAGKNIGQDMLGGFIRLNGTYTTLAEKSFQGKIYAHEKQIWPLVEFDMFSSRVV